MQETLLVKRIRGPGWNHVEIKWSSREKKSRKGRWREWKIVSRSPKSAFNPYFIVRGTNEAIALFLALEIILFLFFFWDGVTCFGRKYRTIIANIFKSVTNSPNQFDSCKPQWRATGYNVINSIKQLLINYFDMDDFERKIMEH